MVLVSIMVVFHKLLYDRSKSPAGNSLLLGSWEVKAHKNELFVRLILNGLWRPFVNLLVLLYTTTITIIG